MHKITKIVTVICLSFTLANAYSVPDSLQNEAKEINDLLINCKFKSAQIKVNGLLKKDSTQPLYYYLKLAALGLETLDRDEVVKKSEFFSTYEKGMQLLQESENSDTDSYLMMLKGFMQTSNSSFKLLSGKYISAVSIGKDGLKSVEKSRELDSSNHDVDYYLGFFSYARGELKNRVPILFWLENSSKEGIVELQRCSDKGLFMNRAADMVLVDILVREGELLKGQKMLTTMLKEYPGSRFLFWTESRLHVANGKKKKAAETFMKLSRSYIADTFIHNGLLSALESMDLLKDSPETQQKYVEEIITLLPESSVPKSEIGNYNKLLTYRKES